MVFILHLLQLLQDLIVGILGYFAYNTLVVRVEKVVFNLEATLTEFMDILNEPVKYRTLKWQFHKEIR